MKRESVPEMTHRHKFIMVSSLALGESNRMAETELLEAGESTDGMAESTAKLREEVMALSGIDIMANSTTFKSTYDILDELADKWADLTDIQQAKFAWLLRNKQK